MTDTAPHPIQRRIAARRPILLPVRIAFLTEPLSKIGTTFGLALDISTGGMQILVGGTVAKRYATDVEIGGTLHVSFIHTELRRVGDIAAHVRWSRVANHEECLLGIAFSRPLQMDTVEAMANLGPVSFTPPRTLWWTALPAGIALILGLLWLREQKNENARALEAAKSAICDDQRADREFYAARDREDQALREAREVIDAGRATAADASTAKEAGVEAAYRKLAGDGGEQTTAYARPDAGSITGGGGGGGNWGGQ